MSPRGRKPKCLERVRDLVREAQSTVDDDLRNDEHLRSDFDTAMADRLVTPEEARHLRAHLALDLEMDRTAASLLRYAQLEVPAVVELVDRQRSVRA